MPTLGEKNNNLLASLLPSILAFVALSVAGLVFYPVYGPLLHHNRSNNGRPDYEIQFREALRRDTVGGRKSAERVYRHLVGAVALPRDCPRLYAPETNSSLLKAMAYDAIGIMRSGRGEQATAFQAFQEGERLAPDNATAMFYLGYGLDRIGRHEDALEIYKKLSMMGLSVNTEEAKTSPRH